MNDEGNLISCYWDIIFFVVSKVQITCFTDYIKIFCDQHMERGPCIKEHGSFYVEENTILN
jgi:hypothetical protein